MWFSCFLRGGSRISAPSANVLEEGAGADGEGGVGGVAAICMCVVNVCICGNVCVCGHTHAYV